MRVDVLNAEGRDAAVDYTAGPGTPAADVHPPVNYWAYSAATRGRFCRHLHEVDPAADAVVVLLRRSNRAALAAVRALKHQGRRVFLSWKETGVHQIESQLVNWRFWERPRLHALHALADGAIASTLASIAYYRRFGGAAYPVHYIPTPYPVDQPAWDFSVPLQERRGIFVGTREFDVPTRRHADALRTAATVARRVGCRVTVLNADGERARRKIFALLDGVPDINLVERKLAYPEYLRLIANHRIVLQRDISQVPGQVAGDALLCRVINLGGNGTTQQITFPEYSAMDDDEVTLAAAAEKLLRDDAAYTQAINLSQTLATEKLSFAAGRKQLESLRR
jgi:hypothetical protein